MEHHFNVEFAIKYGLLEAILINNFWFWIKKNEANKNNFYDGKYWTFNSQKALTELFPYASRQKIRTAIDNLIKNGIIVTGNYNKLPFDRTIWYAFTDYGKKLVQNQQIHCLNLTNENVLNQPMRMYENNQPIPDNKPDNKPDNIKRNFDRFWKEYPRKVSKGNAEKWFTKNNPSEELVNEMINKISLLKETEQWKKDNGQFIPYPTSWLNAKGWEDEVQTVKDESPNYIIDEYGGIQLL